jgi:hypothetical protein
LKCVWVISYTFFKNEQSILKAVGVSPFEKVCFLSVFKEGLLGSFQFLPISLYLLNGDHLPQEENNLYPYNRTNLLFQVSDLFLLHRILYFDTKVFHDYLKRGDLFISIKVVF